jgi:Ser/Thr protein kinase RdoA (MazF antagonist)
MAVFTDIADPQYRDQLLAIENAYEISITSIEGITLGSSDSLFKIWTREHDEALVLTIYETPDVTPNGLTNEAAQRMLRFIDYVASVSAGVTDNAGELVKLVILKPLQAHASTPKQAPYLVLTFEGIQKSVSIVPFVRGKCYANSPEELADPEEAFLVGRALGAYLTIAKSYSNPELFPLYTFDLFAQEIAQVSGDAVAEERLGYVLSGGHAEGSAAESQGRQYMADMMERGSRMVQEWDRVSNRESVYANTLIHGDLFTDNVFFDEEGDVILLDFNETSYGPIGLDIGTALSSWASRHGKPVVGNTLQFLVGFDSVAPLTGEQLAQIPTFVQIGAYRWETFRVRRIGMQDPRQMTMRSPDEFRSIQKGWRELESVFASLSSIEDLVTRINQ